MNRSFPRPPCLWSARLAKLASAMPALAAGVIALALPASATPQPNILFIPVDDLKPLIGAYGAYGAKTPNLDRLAARGVVFLNAHSQQAVCGPSRASVLTGLYPDTTRVWDLATRMRDVRPDTVTLPQYLASRGYVTHGMGKTYDSRCVGEGHDAPSWTIPYGPHFSRHFKFDPSHGPMSGGYRDPETVATRERTLRALGEETFADATERERALRREGGPRFAPATDCADVGDNAYADGLMTDLALETLERLAKRSAPFFFSVGYYKPHLPFNAPKRYWDMHDPATIDLAAFQERSTDGPELAYHEFGELRSFSDIPARGPVPEETQRRLIHGYLATVSYVDAQIGRLLDKLEALGIAERTVVCVWGDHGFHLGDHGLWCKHSNFEQASRSPLIIAGPGVARGLANRSPVGLVDIYPTLVELAGLPVPEVLEGESLAPILSGRQTAVREAVLHQWRTSVRKRPVMGYALRSERHRYVKWIQMDYVAGERSGPLVATELYDYFEDSLETANRAGRPESRRIIDNFERIFAEMGVAQTTTAAPPAPPAPAAH